MKAILPSESDGGRAFSLYTTLTRRSPPNAQSSRERGTRSRANFKAPQRAGVSHNTELDSHQDNKPLLLKTPSQLIVHAIRGLSLCETNVCDQDANASSNKASKPANQHHVQPEWGMTHIPQYSHVEQQVTKYRVQTWAFPVTATLQSGKISHVTTPPSLKVACLSAFFLSQAICFCQNQASLYQQHSTFGRAEIWPRRCSLLSCADKEVL